MMKRESRPTETLTPTAVPRPEGTEREDAATEAAEVVETEATEVVGLAHRTQTLIELRQSTTSRSQISNPSITRIAQVILRSNTPKYALSLTRTMQCLHQASQPPTKQTLARREAQEASEAIGEAVAHILKIRAVTVVANTRNLLSVSRMAGRGPT